MSKMTTLYDAMWKELDSDFVHTNEEAKSCLKTISVCVGKETSSYRFTNKDDGDFEQCLEKAEKAHLNMKCAKKELEIARKARKKDYEKYKCKKDEYDAKKTEYDDRKKDYDIKIKELLIKRFGLEKHKKDFLDKYDMAVSGSGHESFKITTLHSSSLCCLLFFYNVNDNNPLILTLTTNKGNRTIKFTKSVFEFKNIVTLHKNAPSNVDVVLIGEDERKKKVFLFLESKFSEYYIETPLKAKPTCDIKKGYFNKKWSDYKLYQTILEQMQGRCKIDIQPNIEEEVEHKLIVAGEKSFYIKGLMQMISHYIGITNLMNGQYYSSKEEQLIEDEIKNKDDIVYILGEIAFELPNDDAKKALDNYRDNYKLLAEIIAEQKPANKQFEILKDLLLYSKITEGEKNNYKVDEKVKLFYGMN